MIDRRIGKIKVRRGTDSQRQYIVFEEGELVYSTDKKTLYIGDASTSGGILVSNRNYLIKDAGLNPTVPSVCTYGDIIYDKTQGNTYIVGYNLDYSLKLIQIASGDANCCALLQQEILNLYTKLSTLTACITPPDSLITDNGSTLITDSDDWLAI